MGSVLLGYVGKASVLALIVIVCKCSPLFHYVCVGHLKLSFEVVQNLYSLSPISNVFFRD